MNTVFLWAEGADCGTKANLGDLERQAESSHLNQLSPIEEALNSDMSSTPDVEQQVLAARLQQSHLQVKLQALGHALHCMTEWIHDAGRTRIIGHCGMH